MNPIFLSAKKRDVLKHSSLGIPSYSQMMSKGCPSSPPNSYRFFGVPWNHSQKVIGSSRALQTLVGSKTSFFSHKKIMQFFRTNMTCHLPDTPDPPVISESVSSWWLFPQPLWNIWFIWSSNWIMKLQLRVKIKHLWNHQLEKVI